jgi:protein-disulfide isomerase
MTLLAVLVIGGVSQAKAADKAWDLDKTMGKADAPITVIEYSSLTCPHCADFQKETFPKLKAEWIDTGKVKFIHRDFPLDQVALAAAMVSECAGDRYFTFIDTFFASQGTWARSSDPLVAIKGIARLGGMSEAQVTSCLQNQALMSEISARKQDGVERYKIESTPSFVINGKMTAGALPYDDLVKLLK